MYKPFFLFLITLFACAVCKAEGVNDSSFDRSQVSVMVIPYTSKGEDIMFKIEHDAGYRSAIAEINSSLLKMGYSNTKDFKTLKENIDNRKIFTQAESKNELMKFYIQQAPVDVIIEAEILWTDPPGEPQDRQVRLSLKAIDKYTSAVYADNVSIESMEREFPNIQSAVTHALESDGLPEFKKFLEQLDFSFKNVLLIGRQVNLKFEVSVESNVRLSDRIDNERLSDKIEECVKQNAFKGMYKILGDSPAYLDFTVQIPAIDEQGNSVSPSMVIRKKIDSFFFNAGFDVKYSMVGTWVNFILVKK